MRFLRRSIILPSEPKHVAYLSVSEAEGGRSEHVSDVASLTMVIDTYGR